MNDRTPAWALLDRSSFVELDARARVRTLFASSSIPSSG